jgi:hypothetical protein
MGVLFAAYKLHCFCTWSALWAGPDDKPLNIDAGEAFGLKSDNDTGRVEKTGIVGIAVNYGETPPSFG